MTPLIAMPGPWLPEASPGRAPDDASGLPALPALTRLLRRARCRAEAPDWRAGVVAALGGDVQTGAAVLAARACEVEAGSPLCLAAPLHIVAGISRVHLPPGGRPGFDPAEERAWCEAFNAEFGGGGVRMHIAAVGGGWLLEAPFAAAARDQSPDLLVGAALERPRAEGPDERALRRLAAESEMWLAAHGLNAARAARGQLPLNALWFWGGAHAVHLPPLRAPLLIAARGVADAWLAGLAAHTGSPLRAAEDFDAAISSAAAMQASSPHVAPLLVPTPDNQGPSRHYWQMIEENWIAPAVRAQQAGRIAGLDLQIGRSAWQWPRRGPASWLPRVRREWWQVTGEVRP